MAFKKRRMMFIPDVNPNSFVFFFERGTSGTGWSIRDYSIKNRVKELGPHHFPWSADEVHRRAIHSIDAPTVATDNLTFWHDFTRKCNDQYLTSEASRSRPEPQNTASSFPVLDLDQLRGSHKGRKAQDMERILHSANSEDWVTWNFFRILLTQYPTSWWVHLAAAARCRNPELALPFDDRLLPRPTFWAAVPSPAAYENASRERMRTSGNREWVLRANNPEPVEGPSEIDVSLDHDRFLIYTEAKLGSDISMDTKYDPRRNQIIRNIDCLIENAGDRTPMFWLLARDESPDRAYVQLMTAYRSDPALLARELPHRNASQLAEIARNLTILLWSDFRELVCGPGWDEESTAVKQELRRRIVTTLAETA